MAITVPRSTRTQSIPQRAGGPLANPRSARSGLQDLGNALTTIGDAVDQREERQREKERAEFVSDRSSQAEREWAQRFVDRQGEATGEAAGFAGDFDKEFQKFLNEQLAEAPDNTAKELLKTRLGRLRNSLHGRAVAFEATQRQGVRTTKFQAGLSSLAQAAAADPSQWQRLVNQANGDIAAAEANWMRPQAAARFREAAPVMLAASAIETMTQQAPRSTMALLSNPKSDNLLIKVLDTDTRLSLLRSARVEVNRVERKDAEARQVARTELRAVQDLLANGFDPGQERMEALRAQVSVLDGGTQKLSEAEGVFLAIQDAEEMSAQSLFQKVQADEARLRNASRVSTLEVRALEAQQAVLRRKAAKEGASNLPDRVDDLVGVLEGGFSADDELQTIRTEMEGRLDAGELAADLAAAEKTGETLKLLRTAPPGVLQNWINSERSRLNQSDDVLASEVQQLETAEKLLVEMNKEVGRDVLSWAARTGVAEIEPLQLLDLQLGQEGQSTASATMQRRAGQAHAVARHYGVRPVFLTDEDKTQIKQVLNEGSVDQQLALVGSISDGFGRDALSVFGELSKDAPLFSYAGGLSGQGAGQALAAREILVGRKALEAGQAGLPSRVQFETEALSVMGRLFADVPQHRALVLDAARSIYAARAVTAKADPGVIDDDLFKASLDAAIGSVGTGEHKHGGLIEWNDHMTIVPTNMTGGQFSSFLAGLDQAGLEDLSFGDVPPRHGDGTPFTPEDLEFARLIPVGPNLYQLDMSSDRSGMILGGGPGGFFVLDLTRREPLSEILSGGAE